MFRRRRIPALDARALADAQTYLGLERPVRIELAVGPEKPEAYYQFRERLHCIGINPNQTESELSKSIWHELEHARQCEQMFDGDGRDFHQEAFEQAVQFDVTGIVGQLEEMAIHAEDNDYSLRLVRMVRI